MFNRAFPILLAGMALAVTASCGGGSDGSISLAPPAQPAPPADTGSLPITTDNAQDITESVFESVVSSIEIIELVDILGIPSVSDASLGMSEAVIGTVLPEVTVPCDTGESTTTWDDADDNLELSTGDTFIVVFAMCFDGATATTLDGTTTLTNIVIEGDPIAEIAPWRIAMTIGFDGLSGMDDSGTALLNGALSFDINTTDNLILNLSVTIDSLTVQESGVTETLRGYVLAQTFDLNTLTQTITADGTYFSTLLNGEVTFETLQDFVVIGDDNPSSGQMLISDNTSSVLVTVIDNLNVQLEIDTDLDGGVDATIMITWAELDID